MQVARQSQCKQLLLTHFSQRYPKVPEMENVEGAAVAVGFDMLTVSIDSIKEAACLLPHLQQLLGEAEAVAAAP